MTPARQTEGAPLVRRWVMTAARQPMMLSSGPREALAAGQVRVRVAGCGVCHTDLGYAFGGVRTNHPLPLVLGHEISGVVAEVAPDQQALLGRAVIVPAVIPCFQCAQCLADKGLLCRKQIMPGNDLDGGFAEEVIVPGRVLAVVPEYSGDPAALLGRSGVSLAELSVVADAVTTPYQAIVQSGLAAGDLAVFIGVGGVGGFGAQIAKALGAKVVAVDVNDQRLETLRACGVDLALNSKGMDGRELRDRVRDFAKQTGAPAFEWKLFETSGTAAGQDLAFKCLTYGATLSIVGFTLDSVQVRLSNLMAFHARALGNWGCLPSLYPAALQLVLEGKVRIAPFVQTYPLAEINAVFDALHRHAVSHRPVLVPEH